MFHYLSGMSGPALMQGQAKSYRQADTSQSGGEAQERSGPDEGIGKLHGSKPGEECLVVVVVVNEGTCLLFPTGCKHKRGEEGVSRRVRSL